MIEVETKVRRWGRSLGVVIPMEKAKEEKIKEDQTIRLLITKKPNVLRETFGSLKFRRSTDEILDESDRELYNE